MADYYSLLSRAIANLPKTSPPTARRAIYDRARKALNNQLRSLKPPLPESDIVREETALEAAVRRLEAEIDPEAAAEAAAAAVVVTPPAIERPRAPPPPTEPRPILRPPAPPPKPVSPPAPPAAPAVSAAPLKEPRPSTIAPPLAARPTLPRADEKQVAPPVLETKAEPAPNAAPAPTIATTEPSEGSDSAPPLRPPSAPLGQPRDADSQRPVAPRAERSEGRGLWKWAIVAVVAGLVIAVAFGAYLMRSTRPADLAIKEPKAPVTEPPAPEAPAPGQKIIERVGGGTSATPSPETTPAAPAPTATVAATPTPTAVAMPAATPGPVATPAQPPAAQTAPVSADRAAMLLAAPQEVQKPTVYVGNVTWSAQPAAPGSGAGSGIRAEIDIPELKMHASMLMRKNVDPGLPASHTIDLRMTFDDGSPFKGVKDVGVPQMRRDDPPVVTPLLGVRVVINDTYFLVGLNRGDSDIQRNVDAIGSSGWFDFPMLLPDGRIGKLTFEKGSDGESIVAAALAAWKAQ